jgi:hypothetical protein
MPADVLALVRAHDPARTLAPATPEEREGLRRSVVATPTAPYRRARRRPLRAAALVVAATVAALALAAAGWAVYASVFGTPAQVRREFAAETARIPLPPGAWWRAPDLDEHGLYGGRAGRMAALGQATCAWFGYWDRGFRRGDGTQTRAAVAGFGHVRALMPLHPDGAPEDVGGYDAGSLAALDRILAAQRAGEPGPTEQYLRANCR